MYKGSAMLLYMYYLHEDLVSHQVLAKREIDACWMAKGVWVLLVLVYFFWILYMPYFLLFLAMVQSLLSLLVKLEERYPKSWMNKLKETRKGRKQTWCGLS